MPSIALFIKAMLDLYAMMMMENTPGATNCFACFLSSLPPLSFWGILDWNWLNKEVPQQRS